MEMVSASKERHVLVFHCYFPSMSLVLFFANSRISFLTKTLWQKISSQYFNNMANVLYRFSADYSVNHALQVLIAGKDSSDFRD